MKTRVTVEASSKSRPDKGRRREGALTLRRGAIRRSKPSQLMGLLGERKEGTACDFAA